MQECIKLNSHISSKLRMIF